MTVLLTVLALLAFALAALYAGMTFANLALFRAPPPPRLDLPPVSVLIPARDEATNIGPAVAAALASRGTEVEVLVLDDGSTDVTPAIVAETAARDARLRLLEGAPLPAGWNGKQHACWQLAQAARYPLLVFVDADVRLEPDAVARLASGMEAEGLDLLSGFPRQRTGSLAEDLVVPQVLVLLLGYLPLWLARWRPDESFAAACGQLIAVRAEAYRTSGGHKAFAMRIHDGLHLPRLIRRYGGRTDIADAVPLATCRMYDGLAQVWAGFSKNATEGMATPRALPVWTLLLGGGHLLPWLLLPIAWAAGAGIAIAMASLAIALVYMARAALAVRGRQSALSVLLHPAGVAMSLAIQWRALFAARAGKHVEWRGRTYDVA
jgi:hypothetical protein